MSDNQPTSEEEVRLEQQQVVADVLGEQEGMSDKAKIVVVGSAAKRAEENTANLVKPVNKDVRTVI